MEQRCHLAYRSVCLSVCPVGDLRKMADWIWMPFGVVSAVGWGMGVLDGGGDRRMRRGSFRGKCGASHCHQRGLCGVVVLCREGWRHGLSQINFGFLVILAAVILVMHLLQESVLAPPVVSALHCWLMSKHNGSNLYVLLSICWLIYGCIVLY